MANLRSDARSVTVTAPEDITKDSVVVAEGWFGIAMADADSGDSVALAVDQREYEIDVDSLTAAKGDILYIDADGALTNTDTDFPFAKVTVAKDSNNIAWVKLLEQRDKIA